MPDAGSRRFWTPEFVLVVVMLFTLTILVYIVLMVPINISDGSGAVTAKDSLDYRKNILNVIITAFGAWVGAGAAYFFGRENLRESLLAMREMSPKEKLRRTAIREIARPIDWYLKTSDSLGTVLKKLKDEPKRWFLTIVKDDGSMESILDEEGVWRFVENESMKNIQYDDIMKKTVEEVIKYIKENKLKVFEDIYISTTMNNTAGDANDLMQKKGVFVAIIKDDSGKPTHFVTSYDLKKVLLE